MIGRVLEDPHAAAGVAHVYDSLLRDSANTKAAFPECGLPFEGETRWLARGIALPRSGGGERWLIYELLRCSAPLPFRELHVIPDNDGRQAADPDDDLPEEEKRPAWASPRKTAKLDSDDELQSAVPPEANIGRVVIPLAGERFDDIIGKEIIKTPKEQCQYKSTALRRPQGITALGTGAATYSPSAIAPVCVEWRREPIESQRKKGLPASFEALLTVVDALNARNGVFARVRPPTLGTEYLLPTKPRNHWQWAYFNSASKIQRHAMTIDVECDGVCGSLVEFERRKNEHSRAALLIPLDSMPLSDSRLERLLAALVAAEGVWANLKPRPTGVKMVLLKHNRPSADAFAAAICEALRQGG